MIMLPAFVPIAAAAQNKEIDRIAEKYSDRDGFSTTVIRGDISKELSGSLNVEGVDISNIVKEISSIVIVSSDRPDEEFTREVPAAVNAGYSTVLSSSKDGEQVRFLLSENSDSSGKNEFVIVIFGRETNMMVSITGNYTLGYVSKPRKNETGK